MDFILTAAIFLAVALIVGICTITYFNFDTLGISLKKLIFHFTSYVELMVSMSPLENVMTPGFFSTRHSLPPYGYGYTFYPG